MGRKSLLFFQVFLLNTKGKKKKKGCHWVLEIPRESATGDREDLMKETWACEQVGSTGSKTEWEGTGDLSHMATT